MCMKATIAARQLSSSSESCTEHFHHHLSLAFLALPSIQGECFTCAALLLSISRFLSQLLEAGSSGRRGTAFQLPPGNVGEVLYILHVWSHLVQLCVRHLHPRAVGAEQTSCAIPRSRISTTYLRTAPQPVEVPNCATGRPGA